MTDIQAIPAMVLLMIANPKLGLKASPNMPLAKSKVPTAAQASRDMVLRILGKSPAPTMAPAPKRVSTNPYWCASSFKCTRQNKGKSAQKHVEQETNTMVRQSTASSTGEWRTKRTPARIAPTTRSLLVLSADAGRFQDQNTQSTARNEAALSRKTAPGPDIATMKPPIAEPTPRAMFQPMPPRATAPSRFFLVTNSGRTAFQAGLVIAPPTPSIKVSVSKSQGFIHPQRLHTPMAAAATSIQA